MGDRAFDPSLWQVAWEGDQVAGGVLGYLDPAENEEEARKRGYTECVWVWRPWRRRGLARALLVRSVAMFVEMGMEGDGAGRRHAEPARRAAPVRERGLPGRTAPRDLSKAIGLGDPVLDSGAPGRGRSLQRHRMREPERETR